ncbi:hypothetical protein VZT92_018038 [Zoarces viviparus]|uniref:Uncharacterized protein n=1 Tax=Zoarces viviparus TaxID=48416 RepID=A0AAW1EP59_ZOAVI
MGDKHTPRVSSCHFNPSAEWRGRSQSDLWVSEVVFVNTIRVDPRPNVRGIGGFAAAPTQRSSNRFSLNRRRAAAHLPRHGGDREDGRYGDKPEKK